MCLQPRDVEEALKSLPVTLDDTYARILQSIDATYQPKVITALQWITYSRRPLRLEELSHAVVIDSKSNPCLNPNNHLIEPRKLLRILSSLVVISKRPRNAIDIGWVDPEELEELEAVKLAHFSVKEYLASLRILDGPASRFRITEQESNRVIAESSLLYIKSYAGSKNKSSSKQDLEQLRLIQYAYRFWSDHVETTKEATGSYIDDLIFEFLSSDVERSSWLLIYHPDRDYDSPFENDGYNIAASIY